MECHGFAGPYVTSISGTTPLPLRRKTYVFRGILERPERLPSLAD